jgi:hypothetical protein
MSDKPDEILDRQVEACPRCGGGLQQGFGLAGGGFGVYGYCDPCGRVVWKCVIKEQDEEPD